MRHLWIATLLVAACLAGSGRARAQAYDPAAFPQYPQYVQYPDSAPPVAVPAGQVALSPDQLDQLLGPVALYPDPLLSLIFPAATYPQDIAAAQQWLQSTPSPAEDAINAQPWDPSIKGLVHYPTVLKMMNDQMDWTNALGAAFLNQQQDVLDSVQRLRAAAQAQQNLATNAQEQVLADSGAIRIEPVNPGVIYVPTYDPALVYSSPCPITWGVGFGLGDWCDNDFDWGAHFVVVGGGWFTHWNHPADWDRHRGDWDHHPANWHPDPHPWTRIASHPAPRITPAIVTRAGLDHPRPSPARKPDAAHPQPAPARIGNAPAATPSKNVFVPAPNRTDVNRSRERVQPPKPAAAQPAKPPVAVQPAKPVTPPRPVTPPPPRAAAPVRQPTPPPRPVAPAAPRTPAPQPTPRVAPAPQPPASAFQRGPSGGQTRVESSRGHESTHH